MKRVVSLVLLFSFILIYSGCSNNYNAGSTSKVDISGDNYFLYSLKWVNSEELVGLFGYTDIKMDGTDIGRVVLWNRKTNTQRLLYEGKDLPGVLPAGIVIGKGNLIYAYNNSNCLILSTADSGLKGLIQSKQPGVPIVPSPDGLIAYRSENGLAMFPEKERDNLTILEKQLKQKTESGQSYTIFQENPKWSPDGKWVLFSQIASDNIIPSRLGIVSPDEKSKYFDFDKATNHEWASDSKHIIGINEGTYFKGPLEIGIFDITTGESIRTKFDTPIDGQNFRMFNILDTHDTKILLQTHFEYQGKIVKPVLLYNWKTGEKRWITSLNYWTVAAAFAPDGKTIAITGNSETKSVEYIQI